MRKRLAVILTVVAAFVMIGLPAFAWRPVISGDCEGWHVTNPNIQKWNSAEYEMVLDHSIVVAFNTTVDIADNSGSTERTFHVYWRLVGDSEQIEPQDVVGTRSGVCETTTTAAVAGDEATTSTSAETPTTVAASPTTAAAVVLGAQVSAAGGVAAQAETLPFTGVSAISGLAIAAGLVAAGTTCLIWTQRKRASDS